MVMFLGDDPLKEMHYHIIHYKTGEKWDRFTP